MKPTRWTIIGQGLAGTCLAWELWKRQVPFTIVDREQGGSSRVAAGLINPVTGKHFEPSKSIATFLPQAMEFYAEIETLLGTRIWHPHPILRLAGNDKEWAKIQLKAGQPDVARWLANGAHPVAVDGWSGAIEVHSGGRVDTREFLDRSREFFRSHGFYQKADPRFDDTPPHSVWCEGASGLIAGRYGTHRCAKGEILSVRAAGWNEHEIRIGAGGWLVPVGNGHFKVGSTYEWDQLDETPTDRGLETLQALATRLGGADFEIIGHQAGIRPILRRSEPLIGPLGKDQWMFNALGSKGSLYAPGIARQLAAWLTDGTEPDPDYRWSKVEN